MLLTAEQDDVTASGLGVGNNFTIANSPKAFEILSSTLYQDKVGAVVRELICNATDAHTMAGKPWDTILVMLPTLHNPQFIVEDYGPGLSDQDVRELYTTYFRSTKDKDNSAIGGFGLGSKSPFAVADQFTVESRFNGEINSYVCYKSAGLPVINHIGTRVLPANTSTGLTVSVPVSGTNFREWSSKYEDFMRWQPERLGGFFDPANQAIISTQVAPHNKQPLWFLSKALTYPHVFVSRVAYRLNLEAIPGVPNEIIDMFSSTPIVINVPIGSVQVAPNRESLSYDPTTCQTILRILQTAAKDLLQNFTQQLAAAPTLYSAMELIASVENAANLQHIRKLILGAKKSLTWNGQPIPVSIGFDAGEYTTQSPPSPPPPAALSRLTTSTHQHLTLFYPGTITWYGRPSWRKIYRREQRNSCVFRPSTNPDSPQKNKTFYFYAENLTAKTYRTLNHFFDSHNITEQRGAFIFSGVPFDALTSVFTEYGLPTIVDVATLPAPPATGIISAKQYPRTTGYVYQEHTFHPTTTSIDLTVPGYYVKMFDGKVKEISENELTNNISAGYLQLTKPLVGFKKAQLDQKRFVPLLTRFGWVQLTSQNLPLIIGEETIRNESRWQQLINSRIARQRTRDYRDATTLIFSGAKEISEAYPNTIVGQYLTKLLKAIPHKHLNGSYAPSLIFSHSWEATDPTYILLNNARKQGVAEAEALIAEWKQILEQFPMLQLVSSEYNNACLPILETYLT